jgi:ABC-2 type transport system ATP-binding protein
MIEIEGLRKTFQTRDRSQRWWHALLPTEPTRTIVALDNLSLSIPAGSFFSLLGANGAGKTTTMKVLCTLLLPDAGAARVAGYDVVRQPRQVRACLGVSIRGERSVYWKLTGRQNLEYFAQLAGYGGAALHRRVGSTVEVIGLGERIDDYVERYSMGMKQRLAIGCALVHEPPVLLLDEPTIGLDPHGARALRAFIHDELCRNRGVTIVYTTHYMHEAEELSDRIAVLHGGRIVAQGTPTEVCAGVADRAVVRLQFRPMTPAAEQALREHPAVGNLTSVLAHDEVATLHLTLRDSHAPVAGLVDCATAAGAHLVSAQVLRPSLEDAFVALTGTSVSASGEAVHAHAG